MSLEDIMDAVAVNAATNLAAADATTGLPGLKACYSAAASAEGATGVPLAIEDSPVGVVQPGGGELEAGNYELFLHRLELNIWVVARDLTYAYRTIVPFVDRARVLFRSDIDANGTAVRVLMTGYGGIEHDVDNQVHFLVLPIELEALELSTANPYST